MGPPICSCVWRSHLFGAGLADARKTAIWQVAWDQGAKTLISCRPPCLARHPRLLHGPDHGGIEPRLAPGEVAEWLNAPHSKCGIGASLSGVRIPPSPPAHTEVQQNQYVIDWHRLFRPRLVHTGGARNSFDDSSEIPRSKSSERMCGSPGSLYYYFSDQLPCLNLVCEPKGVGSAVLIRAVPTHNVNEMFTRRCSWYRKTDRAVPEYLNDVTRRNRNLCNGPAVLSEALGINDESKVGLSIFDPPFEIRRALERPVLISGIRIGLDKQFERWERNGDPRSRLPSINEFGGKKWRSGAADFRDYCRHSSFEQIWQPR